MGAFNYNYLLNPNSGYTKYGLITRVDFWNKITPIIKYFRPILITI